MKLIPIFYFLKDGRVKVIWCEHVTNVEYDARWMRDIDIVGVADCDIAAREDICDNLEAAHDLVRDHYIQDNTLNSLNSLTPLPGGGGYIGY